MARVLLAATHNTGKVAELRALLSDLDWEVRTLVDETPEFEETGATFADNARGKARFYAGITELPALADDSGLEIDALDGEPGVRSARYIDPSLTPAQRNREVLERLRDVPNERRSARFVCHLALATPAGLVHETEGTCEGRITRAPYGEGGFGYDPIFLVPGLGKTFAELTRDQKARLSHRGRAVRAMVQFLRSWSPPPGVS